MNTIYKFGSTGSVEQMKIIDLQAADNVRVPAAVEAVSAAATLVSAAMSAIKVNKTGDIMTDDLDIRLSENNLRIFGVTDANS